MVLVGKVNDIQLYFVFNKHPEVVKDIEIEKNELFSGKFKFQEKT